MPRPSRNLDRALLAAGRALYPATGCAGLTIRQVCEAAGVNTGMFNYHFGTREKFLRAVMQQAYEEMFAPFTLEVARPPGAAALAAVDYLRRAFRVLGRFLRDNRPFIGRMLADALADEPVARDFLRDNLPRHASVLAGLIAEGQASGALRPMALAQALGTCAGALAMPILAGGAIADSGLMPRASARALADAVLGDDAIDERIDLVLRALAVPARPAGKSRKERR